MASILDYWQGKTSSSRNQSSYSQRTDNTLAGKASILQPVYTVKKPAATTSAGGQNQSLATTATPTSSTAKKAASSTKAPVAPTVAVTQPVATELTKEQQLQVDADKMGLTGVKRQAFIEEKRGISPKIESTKKYASASKAENASGITTSAPVDAGLSELEKTITDRATKLNQEIASNKISSDLDITANTGGYELPTDADYKQLYELQKAGANEEYNALLNDIKNRYSGAREQQQQVNRRNTGTVSAFLGRAGSFSTAGGQSMAVQQAQANQSEMNRLAQEEAQALADAANAKNAGDLANLESYLNQADKLREERNAIRTQNISLGLTMADREIEAQQRAEEQAAQEAEYYSNLSPDELAKQDKATITKLESTLGMPVGYISKLSQAQQDVSDAKSEADATAQAIKLFDVAKEIPTGLTYKLNDGTVIRGAMQPEGKVLELTSANGDMAIVTIDQNTGELLKKIELPGIISDIKASALFRANSGGSGSGGAYANFDAQDISVLQALKDNVGKPISETVQELSAIYAAYGQEVPANIAELQASSAPLDMSMTYVLADALSDNISANIDDASKFLQGNTKTTTTKVGDESYLVTYDADSPNGGNIGYTPLTPTASESKPGFWARLFGGASEVTTD